MRESLMELSVSICTDATVSLLNVFAVDFYGGTLPSVKGIASFPKVTQSRNFGWPLAR